MMMNEPSVDSNGPGAGNPQQGRDLAANDHPRTHSGSAGPTESDRQESARRVLTLIGSQADDFVYYVPLCGQGRGDGSDRCVEAVRSGLCDHGTELIVDVDGLRHNIDPASPDAPYDNLVLDLAASLLGRGQVDVGKLMSEWLDADVLTFLSAMASFTRSNVVEPYDDLII